MIMSSRPEKSHLSLYFQFIARWVPKSVSLWRAKSRPNKSVLNELTKYSRPEIQQPTPNDGPEQRATEIRRSAWNESTFSAQQQAHCFFVPCSRYLFSWVSLYMNLPVFFRTLQHNKYSMTDGCGASLISWLIVVPWISIMKISIRTELMKKTYIWVLLGRIIFGKRVWEASATSKEGKGSWTEFALHCRKVIFQHQNRRHPDRRHRRPGSCDGSSWL